jgi:hypothetical protein
MADDTALSALLSELLGIASAPMTAAQRLSRAEPLFAQAGVSMDEVRRHLGRADLPWNVAKAEAFGISPETWLQAIETVAPPPDAGLGRFLDSLHQAESAAAMLRAGYVPSRTAAGKLDWQRRR